MFYREYGLPQARLRAWGKSYEWERNRLGTDSYGLPCLRCFEIAACDELDQSVPKEQVTGMTRIIAIPGGAVTWEQGDDHPLRPLKIRAC